MDWLDDLHYKIGWTRDHGAAYLVSLYRETQPNIVARWIRNRPELTTFDPGLWRLGLAEAAVGGTYYDATPVESGVFIGL